MNMYIQLFRMGNAVMGILGVVVAAFMAAGLDMIDEWQNLLISSLVVFMFMCGGNALNDYIDYEIDRTAHPDRPIPSGRMTRQQAKNAAIVMFGTSIVISFITLDIAIIAIVIIAATLMVAYEVLLKQRGFIGNVTIAVLTAMLFLLGGAAVGRMEDNIVVALMAMLVSVGREIAKDIEDMDSDEGRLTLPMRIGVRNASILSCVFFIAGPLLSIAPMVWHSYGPLYYTVVLADVLFVYCAAIVFKDQHKAEKLAKVGMMLGLVAFVLGAIRF